MADNYLKNLLGENEHIIFVTRQHWLALLGQILAKACWPWAPAGRALGSKCAFAPTRGPITIPTLWQTRCAWRLGTRDCACR